MTARAIVLSSIGVLACTSAVRLPGPGRSQSGWRRAPPKPGSSITHTKLCECASCEVAHCCAGEVARGAQATCGDGYDFTKEGCGLDVASCTGRCTKHVWRVPLAESCDKRPEACC